MNEVPIEFGPPNPAVTEIIKIIYNLFKGVMVKNWNNK